MNNGDTTNGDYKNMDETPNTFDDTKMGVVRDHIQDEIISFSEGH